MLDDVGELGRCVVLELVNGGSLQQLADSMPDHILPERLTARFTRMLFHGPGGGL